jgi:DNA phosphorothioation-dependent restriction protein DptH
VSFELEEAIGKGALISFKKDNDWRSIKRDNGILYVELTENDAYYGIAKEINKLDMEFDNGELDIPVSHLIRNRDLDSLKEIVVKDIVEEHNESLDDEESHDFKEDKNEEVEVVEGDLPKVKEVEEKKGTIRVLLGEAQGSTKKIYWEYGNKGLANRHMLITGKSGNGKTYFIQCALKELVDSGIPAVIIDYTDGFKSSQLEPEFKEYLGDRFKQILVASENFPLNPFKKGRKELDENLFIDENAVDVAERFKSVIGAVYKDLGIQQLNSIYQAIMRGLSKYGGKLNLSAFRSELEEDNSSYAQTASSQLATLLDKNPFEESKEFEWADLEKDGGKVVIIQLTSYSKEIQRIITEMILWDLWNYKSQHGSKDKPFAVILDEAQNLNFGDNSPSTKILTEGRKFGWSAWFATQFLKGQMDKATISRLQNSAQKIYFAQTEEEATVVANGFADNSEDKKSWRNKLINLEKGSCIVYSPIEGGEGKLLPAKPIKINITSLNDRIK